MTQEQLEAYAYAVIYWAAQKVTNRDASSSIDSDYDERLSRDDLEKVMKIVKGPWTIEFQQLSDFGW